MTKICGSVNEAGIGIFDKTVVLYIDGSLLVDGTIVGSKIAANSIDTTSLKAGTITADKIVTGAITTDKINESAVTTALIAENAVTDITVTQHAIGTVDTAWDGDIGWVSDDIIFDNGERNDAGTGARALMTFTCNIGNRNLSRLPLQYDTAGHIFAEVKLVRRVWKDYLNNGEGAWSNLTDTEGYTMKFDNMNTRSNLPAIYQREVNYTGKIKYNWYIVSQPNRNGDPFVVSDSQTILQGIKR